jgi:hypothetical protein
MHINTMIKNKIRQEPGWLDYTALNPNTGKIYAANTAPILSLIDGNNRNNIIRNLRFPINQVSSRKS